MFFKHWDVIAAFFFYYLKFYCVNLVSSDYAQYLKHYVDKTGNILEGDQGNDYEQYNEIDKDNLKKPINKSYDCWISLNAKKHFEAMDELDKKYADVKKDYQVKVGDQMDSMMLEEFLNTRGAAHRTVYKAGGDPQQIPAGINLGGQCMMRMPNSILFFHRMKLRNSTNFKVNYLHNDLENMALISRLGLNDLHLVGAYERSVTDQKPSVLYYRPTFGQIEILLKNVDYKMEARLRMMSDRLTIELINSELIIHDDILMTYEREAAWNNPVITKLETRNIDDFLQRLKTDLDLWLKDYFNDYLMYYKLPDVDNTQFQEYDAMKTILFNEYLSYAINVIRQKIHDLGGQALSLPAFTMFSVPNMVLEINGGVLRGLDTMYQRSVGTGRKLDKIRYVDVVVGFSKLMVEYKFEAVVPNGSPPLTGTLMMSANELSAHLGITLVKDPDSVDLNFDFIQQLKPESLTVEGSTNRLIANFKHQLENQIIAIMSNAIVHNIKMLNTITRCVPFIYGHPDEDARNPKNQSTNKK